MQQISDGSDISDVKKYQDMDGYGHDVQASFIILFDHWIRKLLTPHTC